MGHNKPAGVILFDLDGCIIDSTEPFVRCINASLGDHGLAAIPPAELATHIGPPLQHIIATLLASQEADPGLMEPVIDGYRERYRTMSIERAITYPGVVEAIGTLAGSERVGVCTSKPERFALPILEHLGLLGHFEVVAGPGLTEAESKIDTMGRALAELEPVEWEASIMIGDRHHDIDAAIHHGLISVGVTWGFGSRDELEQAGATRVIDHPSELTAVIEAARHP